MHGGAHAQHIHRRIRAGRARLALGALPLAEESDLPTLVRALMQTLTAASTGRVLRGLRAQLGAVGAETLALLLQVVCNRLRVLVSALADQAELIISTPQKAARHHAYTAQPHSDSVALRAQCRAYQDETEHLVRALSDTRARIAELERENEVLGGIVRRRGRALMGEQAATDRLIPTEPEERLSTAMRI